MGDDVIEKILSKLPVKSLLRFSCVSKTWYSTISDPEFSKMIMLPGLLICENFRDFSAIPIESLLKKDRAATTPLASFPWDWDCYSCKNTCLGSCNGLICVVGTSGLFICNPSTRKFKTLPRPRRYLENLWRSYAWFGYDESIDDYKLVWLTFSTKRRKAAELDVLTMKSNTWRRQAVELFVEPRRGDINRRDDDISTGGGVLCNRAIHWLTERCILVLDLDTGECGRLDIFRNSTAWVGSLDGERLWLCNHVIDDGFSVSDLWVMKEYGVVSSWTRLVSIRVAIREDALRMYPILLLSKEKEEMVLLCTFAAGQESGPVVRLRVEDGKVKNEEILLGVPTNPFATNIILPMEESFVSID